MRGALLHHPAGIEHHDAVAHLAHHRDVVGHEHQSQAHLHLALPQDNEEAGLLGGIEHAGGLVGDQQLGPRHQGPSHHDALQLPS